MSQLREIWRDRVTLLRLDWIVTLTRWILAIAPAGLRADPEANAAIVQLADRITAQAAQLEWRLHVRNRNHR